MTHFFIKLFLVYVLTAGENNHKKSAENNQLQSIEYRQ